MRIWNVVLIVLSALNLWLEYRETKKRGRKMYKTLVIFDIFCIIAGLVL
jgi:hypothetical protein